MNHLSNGSHCALNQRERLSHSGDWHALARPGDLGSEPRFEGSRSLNSPQSPKCEFCCNPGRHGTPTPIRQPAGNPCHPPGACPANNPKNSRNDRPLRGRASADPPLLRDQEGGQPLERWGTLRTGRMAPGAWHVRIPEASPIEAECDLCPHRAGRAALSRDHSCGVHAVTGGRTRCADPGHLRWPWNCRPLCLDRPQPRDRQRQGAESAGDPSALPLFRPDGPRRKSTGPRVCARGVRDRVAAATPTASDIRTRSCGSAALADRTARARLTP